MPKFSEKEKEVIYSKLRIVGESLFTQYGLKKVTVDDIIKHIGIGKGTFYHFYENKEHLFMDIFNKCQAQVFIDINELVNVDMPMNQKLYHMILLLIRKFNEHPLLSMISADDFELLQCKVPKECLIENDMDDRLLLLKAKDAGIEFKYPEEIVIKVIRSIFMVANAYRRDNDKMEVVNILSKAIAQSLVE